MKILKKKTNIYLYAAVNILIIFAAAFYSRSFIITALSLITGFLLFIFYRQFLQFKINYIFKSFIIILILIIILLAFNVIMTNIFAQLINLNINIRIFEYSNIYYLFALVMILFAIAHLFSSDSAGDSKQSADKTGSINSAGKDKILDTSVIIDGRIVDLCNLNFIEGTLIIPKFILKELQTIADSHDNLKRNRGRRGLEVLNRIQNELKQSIKISDEDFPQIKEADEKLIQLAKKTGASLITNDYNLNKVAELQAVAVVNLNDLANALKPVMLPGEQIEILIIKEGKEHNQGIGYLNDGTMVVIDNANKNLNKIVKAVVTSTIQTSAGRMIFGKKPEDLNK